MSRKKFLCLDCSVDTGKNGEFYMLKDSIWLSIVSSREGMLCIKCLEKRLKRPLTSHDFNDSYVNKMDSAGLTKSLLLISRLKA